MEITLFQRMSKNMHITIFSDSMNDYVRHDDIIDY